MLVGTETELVVSTLVAWRVLGEVERDVGEADEDELETAVVVVPNKVLPELEIDGGRVEAVPSPAPVNKLAEDMLPNQPHSNVRAGRGRGENSQGIPTTTRYMANSCRIQNED